MQSSSIQDQHGPIGPQESWKYVFGFLGWLAAVFGAVTIATFSYNTYSESLVSEAEETLASKPLDASKAKAAFETLKSSHVLAGWKVPKRILPASDPVLGALDEEKLATAVRELSEFPVESSVALGKCGDDIRCIIGALGQAVNQDAKRSTRRPSPAIVLYQYLSIRRSMSKGVSLTPELLVFSQQHPTVWVRAFDNEILNGSGIPSQSDETLLTVLLESRKEATRNTWIIAWYLLICFIVIGTTWFVWWRYQKPNVEVASQA